MEQNLNCEKNAQGQLIGMILNLKIVLLLFCIKNVIDLFPTASHN